MNKNSTVETFGVAQIITDIVNENINHCLLSCYYWVKVVILTK